MSGIRTDGDISNAAHDGPVDLFMQSAAKAWVRFTGTGTVTVEDSVNTSSITDGGTGIYTQNFNTSMGNANYAFSLAANTNEQVNGGATTLGGHPFVTANSSGTATDAGRVSAVIHGDLA